MPLPPFIRHFAFVEKVRAIFDDTIALAGSVSTGSVSTGSVSTGWAIRVAPSHV
jgi:hypothetical protein